MKRKRSILIEDKGMQLFSDSEMIPRKTVTQQEFECIFQPNALAVVNAVEDAWDKLTKLCMDTKPNFQNRNFKANNLNSFVQGYLSECPGFLTEVKDGRFSIVVDGNKFFPKKVSKHLKPSNIQTKTVIMYDNQESNDENDVVPITYIGYRVDTWSSLVGVYAIHMESNAIAWISDLSSLAYKDMQEIRFNSVSNDDVSVTLKKEKKQKTI